MLEPNERPMLRVVIKLTVPVPPTAMAVLALFKLIGPLAKTARLLSAARFIAPANVMEPSAAVDEPIVRDAVKSGSALIVIVSPALPRLIVSEPVGLANVV